MYTHLVSSYMFHVWGLYIYVYTGKDQETKTGSKVSTFTLIAKENEGLLRI